MCESILSSVIANFIFLALMIIFAWILFYFTKRRILYNFFNIKSSQRLKIYLSNLLITKGGAVGIDNVNRSYQGQTVAFLEYLTSEKFRKIFYYPIQPLNEQPNFLKKILFTDINVEILASPLNGNEIDLNASIISLGSPSYNAASKYIEENLNSHCRFQNDNRELAIKNTSPITDPTQAFIEKIIDTNNNRSFFYVAGLSELGTTGAMQILTSEWNRFRKKYGKDKPFLIVVKINPMSLPPGPIQWSVIFEREN